MGYSTPPPILRTNSTYAGRKDIIGRWPAIRAVNQSRDTSFWLVNLALVLSHSLVAIWVANQPLTLVLLMTVIVSPVYSYAAFGMFHEAMHDVALPREYPRAIHLAFQLLTNLPICTGLIAPFSVTHRGHHSHQGIAEIDIKYPSVQFMLIFDTNPFTRLIYLLLSPAFYIYRLYQSHLKMDHFYETLWLTILNHTVEFGYLSALFYFGNGYSLLYMIGGLWLNYTLMFQGIQNNSDHMVDDQGNAHTFSSYGWWNLISANIGYHREHHDFPSVPGRYLPVLTSVAKEYYLDEDIEHLHDYYFSGALEILLADEGKGLTTLSPKKNVNNNML